MSPHLEGFKAKDIEVIYLTDPVDEFWMPLVGTFEDKSFTSITKGGVNLDKFASDESTDESKDEAASIDALIEAMKEKLGASVADIRISKTLTDSPACLVADENGMDLQMQRLMRQHDPNFTEPPRIFELNPQHDLVKSLNQLAHDGNQDELVEDASHLLFEQSLILEGKAPENLGAFSAHDKIDDQRRQAIVCLKGKRIFDC